MFGLNEKGAISHQQRPEHGVPGVRVPVDYHSRLVIHELDMRHLRPKETGFLDPPYQMRLIDLDDFAQPHVEKRRVA